MSQMYVMEPPTSGKVVLRTNYGDLDVELWPKEAPRAVRNFVQLCMEGYYDGCLFHRIMKDFMVQTGDPTNTGTGGESIYGAPFIDEFHQRLRFNHRGLVAMANEGPDSNRSQFFITLDRTDGLDRKNTIFGKITGDTIFNLLRIAGVETDADDRPVFPVKITGVTILHNPFEDIEPRDRRAEIDAARAAAEKAAAPKVRARAIKNKALLSFQGDDDEEEEADADVPKRKLVSLHETVTDDPRLSSAPAVDIDAARREVEAARAARSAAAAAAVKETPKRPRSPDSDDDIDGNISSSDDEGPKPPTDGRSAVQREIEAVRGKVLAYKSRGATGASLSAEKAKEADDLASPLEAMREKYVKQRRRREANREEETLAMLNKFKGKLQSSGTAEAEPEAAAERCARHELLNWYAMIHICNLGLIQG